MNIRKIEDVEAKIRQKGIDDLLLKSSDDSNPNETKTNDINSRVTGESSNSEIEQLQNLKDMMEKHMDLDDTNPNSD
eukprot:CAMPEP_0116946670 /NCGR_PEP_ID=MMETSP0467-20121206/37145_1 /TAXON_ID=283647 /ORGANISM="Mesodinium pulex, Strain SPMC105" /LENGTH=76 /DNA_ID=CAMNT_0004630535 /DNA_START=461 /DNA_END=691 /DNA_ORIENTATION=-